MRQGAITSCALYDIYAQRHGSRMIILLRSEIRSRVEY